MQNFQKKLYICHSQNLSLHFSYLLKAYMDNNTSSNSYEIFNLTPLYIHTQKLFLFVGEEPQKSKFRIDYEEQKRSLVQNHKSFNRRNIHTWDKATALSGGMQGRIHTPPRTGSLFIGG